MLTSYFCFEISHLNRSHFQNTKIKIELHPTKVGYAKNTTLVGFNFSGKDLFFLRKILFLYTFT